LVLIGASPSLPVAAVELDAAFITFSYRDGQISDDFVRWVAEVGARRPIGAAPGMVLGDIVAGVCGASSDVNDRLFRLSFSAQGVSVDETGVVEVPESGTLLVPPCLPTPRTDDVARLVLSGESFWDFARGTEAPFTPVTEIRLIPRTQVTAAANDAPQRDSLAELDVSSAIEVQDYIRRTFERRSLNHEPDGVKALWAFLAANYMVFRGADRAMAADAAAMILAGLGDPGGRMQAAMRMALDRWSGENALSSDDWLRVFRESEVVTTGAYLDRVKWIDPAGGSKAPTDLQPGDIVVAPSLVTQSVRIPIDGTLTGKGDGEHTAAYVRGNQPPILEAPVVASDGPDPAPPLSDEEIELLDSQGMDSVDDTRCANATYANWGTPEFVRDFTATATRARLVSYRAGNVEPHVTIVVVDSGFVLSASERRSAFRERHFELIDEALLDSAPPPGPGKRRIHGTAVTGVALGGIDLWGVAQTLGLGVKVEPHTIYEQFGVGDQIVSSVQFEKVWDAIGSGGDIFNLSFASRNENAMIFFERFLDDPDKLFIVAAGNNNMNDGDEGVNLDGSELRPQLFGDRAPNMIIVAAFDGTDAAWFSNVSPKLVSIAAPGCAIGSWAPSDDNRSYVEQSFTGTSYASPIVAHIAAIVKTLMPANRDTPFWVRARVLASADLLSALTDDVEDGRLLNPIKAVSIFEDVVEVERDGQRQLLFGTVSRDLEDYCEDAPLPPDSTLLKFARNPKPDGDDDAVFYTMRDEAMKSLRCKSTSNVIRFKPTMGEGFNLNVQDIVDIVFRVD
jgi:subtilisin family serine protease